MSGDLHTGHRLSPSIFWCALCVVISACSHAPDPTLNLGMNNWIGYAPMYLVDQEAGSDLPLSVSIMGSSTDVKHGLRSGTLDAGALTLDEAIRLSAEGIPLDIVLVFNVSDGADAIVAHPRIRTIRDLRGQTVAVEPTAASMLLLISALKQHGMTAGDIYRLNCTFDQHSLCFEQADAVVSFEPGVSELLSQGGHIIFDSQAIPGEIIDVLVVRKDIPDSVRLQLPAILDRYFYFLNRLQQDPNPYLQLVQPLTDLTPEQLSIAYEGIWQPDVEDNADLLNNTVGERIADLQRFLKQHQLMNGAQQHQLSCSTLLKGESI